MKTGIIFDMDGTLWDSASEVAAAWSQVTAAELGRQVTKEDLYRTMGMPMNELAKAIFPDYELSELLPVFEEGFQKENDYLLKHGAALYPELIPTICLLAKTYPLYIVSNCQEGYIEAFLNHYQLESYFQDFICYGTNQLPKADNIARIIARNHLDRGIYVGDIQADYEAALAGGAEFIHAAYGFGVVDADVPAITSFQELPDVLKNMAPQSRSSNCKNA